VLFRSFLREIVGKATHGIDLHTGAVHRENLPQIRGAFDKEGLIEGLAKAFGAPVILNSELRDGSLREAAAALGVPVLVYEGGEALRFDEPAINAGVRGVLEVMRALRMVRAGRGGGHPAHPQAVVARCSSWVRAPQSGVLREVIPLGSQVKKNDPLGLIADPYGENEVPVLAPFAGVVIGKVNLPLVNEGEALYHIARFGETDTIGQPYPETTLETEQLALEDSLS
jgi:predicted deacylase